MVVFNTSISDQNTNPNVSIFDKSKLISIVVYDFSDAVG